MRLLALFLAGFGVSSACSLSFFPISVGRSFQMKVSSYDGPVKGLLLKLDDAHGGTQSAVTGDNGIAEFRNVPPGTYFTGADHDNGYGIEVDVKPNGPADTTFSNALAIH